MRERGERSAATITQTKNMVNPGGSSSTHAKHERQGHAKEHHGEGAKAVAVMRAPGHGSGLRVYKV